MFSDYPFLWLISVPFFISDQTCGWRVVAAGSAEPRPRSVFLCQFPHIQFQSPYQNDLHRSVTTPFPGESNLRLCGDWWFLVLFFLILNSMTLGKSLKLSFQTLASLSAKLP